MRLCVPLLGVNKSVLLAQQVSHMEYTVLHATVSNTANESLGRPAGGEGKGDLKGHLITFRPPTFSWWQIAAPCDLVVGGKQSGKGTHFEEDSSSPPWLLLQVQ